MSNKGKPFVVLAFGEHGVRYGAGTNAGGSVVPLPLAELLVSCKADSFDFMRDGCVAYFSGSHRANRALDRLVCDAEALRDTKFPTLGIGLAYGCLIRQHNWLGRLKPNFRADAEIVDSALAGIQGAQTYREDLYQLRNRNVAGSA